MFLLGACVQPEMRIHNLSNEEVLRLLPPSPGEVIEVKGDDEKKFHGFLMKLPVTNKWKTLTLANVSCTVDLPDQPIQDFSMRVLQQDDWAKLLLYPVFQGQFGIIEAVEIELHKFTPQSLQEYIVEEKKFVTDFIAPSPTGVFQEWERVTEHPTLSTKEQTVWQIWYRKDVKYKNGNILRITGRLNKYSIQKTGESLFPKMDATTRRVIESITLLE